MKHGWGWNQTQKCIQTRLGTSCLYEVGLKLQTFQHLWWTWSKRKSPNVLNWIQESTKLQRCLWLVRRQVSGLERGLDVNEGIQIADSVWIMFSRGAFFSVLTFNEWSFFSSVFLGGDCLLSRKTTCPPTCVTTEAADVSVFLSPRGGTWASTCCVHTHLDTHTPCWGLSTKREIASRCTKVPLTTTTKKLLQEEAIHACFTFSLPATRATYSLTWPWLNGGSRLPPPRLFPVKSPPILQTAAISWAVQRTPAQCRYVVSFELPADPSSTAEGHSRAQGGLRPFG